MNYRHIYHAGNFADVVKHLMLALALEHLKKKDAPFCVIDAHGGCGIYDLRSEQAQKTREWEAGIGRFKDTDMPEDFRLYYDSVAQDLQQNLYSGSPLQIARSLRPQDRLIANELHPEDAATLRQNLRLYKNTVVTEQDAYQCIRAHVPPKEKRGLVLIDPPFEERDEFETLARQMGEWKKRFATGIYLLWYPVKAHLAVEAMKRAAADSGFARVWFIETLLHPRPVPDVFNGSGLIVFNAPYRLPERMDALIPYLKENLGFVETRSDWLTPA
jgi:23S rRNA (adenine2030-N6)-methyltransferase